ncbi:hypothetical protein DICPUDRAFT_26772 [Dictyostelium purpureum]|uniref:Peptidase M28 domain-containing protein n=1 Tax=Dictyostelium purpureum TaxID=5786 RepID=F0Z989_DICPU|nr:uncharacterized protein DICPUDRAFT_26772 [Dictyostelium purpureum]EGC39509.1 hypothetical protein DICPUDRAFT_26772 [Dictyostelium purpureum]|eukprot:XP_003283956.1 hypothetical protein DICPUDRAFT_26772 [Dictyostelium purpureum]
MKKYTESGIPVIQEHLKHILKERVVDTESHKEVQQYIISQFENRKLENIEGIDDEDLEEYPFENVWNIELDQFKDTTPLGEKTFTNIIISSNSIKTDPHSQSLILSAHYDSKYFEEFSFLGATDSAVPCSMLIDLAHSLEHQIINSNKKIILIFFDGEEAFKHWSDTDSIYGARHLASVLENRVIEHKKTSKSFYELVDCLILIDLIGVSDPKFYQFRKDTEDLFLKLSDIEEKLSLKRLIQPKAGRYFNNRYLTGDIQDDHVPFKKHVKTLHIIPYPFPNTWHTEKDNYSILDFDTIDDILKIFKVFVGSTL